MATWGSQTWGYENWGTLGDVSITVSGQSTLSLSVGSVDVQSVPGWGTQYWGAGEWGDLKSPEVSLTGQELTSTTATVTAFTDVTVEPTGQELGPIIIGDYVEGISVEASPTGLESNSIVNSVFGGEVVTVEVTSPSNDPWGNTLVGWGNGLWGVGDGITLLGETVAGTQADANVEVTGQELQSGTDGAVLGVSILIEAATNAQLDFTIGNYFAGEVVEVQVTTASAIPWGETAWGDGFWGNGVGTDIAIGADAVLVPSIDVPVTGIDVNSTTGTLSITADANLSLTGQELESLLGDENAFTDVTIEVSGQELTTELNDVVAGISQLVIPTGLEATATSGTMGINAWAVVDPNSSTTWSVVDKAAA
jgi:hypothetical protein